MNFLYKDKILSAIAITSILFFCGIAAEIRAQSNINDDLQPAKTTVNKAKRSKSGKSSKTSKTSKKTPTVYRRPKTPAPISAPIPAPETPSDVFARYMNFQQSSSVSSTDWDNVIKQLNATLQANPNDKTAKTQLAVAQGEAAFSRGDYSNALIQYNAASQLMPESSLPYYGIGKVYLNTKQPVEAEKAFEKASKLNLTFALAYKGLGDALTAQGKTKKAQNYYKQAAQIGINSGQASNAGNAAVNQVRTPNTAANPAQPAPTPMESAYDRDLKTARALTIQKKWSQSLNKLQTLAATNPTAEVYVMMGDNYYGKHAWISAQQAYRKAAEINPNSAVAFFKSGQVLYETNEYKAAADAFEKSLILDQNGATINRLEARKMADKASEKASDGGRDKKKFGIF